MVGGALLPVAFFAAQSGGRQAGVPLLLVYCSLRNILWHESVKLQSGSPGRLSRIASGFADHGLPAASASLAVYNSGLMGMSLCEASFGVGLNLVL
jgi:hypothetical protein